MLTTTKNFNDWAATQAALDILRGLPEGRYPLREQAVAIRAGLRAASRSLTARKGWAVRAQALADTRSVVDLVGPEVQQLLASGAAVLELREKRAA